jgi:ankyrin repeat protein
MQTRPVLLLVLLCSSLAACQTPEEKSAMLQDAVLTRRVERVASALARGANPNQYTPDGRALVEVAVVVCDEPVVRALIGAKANPNLSSRATGGHVGGWTALMEAASSRSCGAPMVELLLGAGADPNLRTHEGLTALMVVAHPDVADSMKKANLLLAARADIHAQDNKKQTALLMAATERHTALVKLLCELGANVNQKDSEMELSPLMRSAYAGDKETLEILLGRGAQIDDVNARGETALMIAAQQDHATVVKLLLEAGANPGLTDKYGKSAVDLAKARGASEALDALKRGQKR